MYSPRIIAISLLAIYSLILVLIELFTSQDYIRHYFTDISGPVFFYAVNTSLSVILFFGTALVFCICLVMSGPMANPSQKQIFYITQILLFVYLGLDDRFLIHDLVLPHFGINGDYILAVLAVVEGVVLLKLGKVLNENNAIRTYFLLAVLFSLFMFIADLFLPPELVLRLSMEDLSKTWSAFFLFLFAWAYFKKELNQIKSKMI